MRLSITVSHSYNYLQKKEGKIASMYYSYLYETMISCLALHYDIFSPY